MTASRAILAKRIFDGDHFHRNAAIIMRQGRIEGLVAAADLPAGIARHEAEGDLICPGFVDWQVNGGGGVLFNETPTREGVAAIARAHLAYGTTACLPTVITDAPEVTNAAADAVAQAIAAGVPGVSGIHFEGPHLSVEKRGVHDPSFIRPLERRDFERMTRRGLGRVVATVAPESASLDDISALAEAGVLVSIGHTRADYATAQKCFRAGASAVTHLFNAMAPLHHRDPGLVGAAMENPDVWCGLIADGHHLHASMLRMIFAAVPTERLTLVTDAMPSVGFAGDAFVLNGRTVRRVNGRLTITDGTLAGSDLDMIAAVRFAVSKCGADLAAALQMASRNPAKMLGLADCGHLRTGARADLLVLSEALDLKSVWLGGNRQEFPEKARL
ncbi:N-acetylglucosamine-6-phosphate deacetylase [Chelatococcus asaccharovorans]|uniref:N-acetylglucosamine-6-phosphate deacetylase n=1 Tax=Chelatococcus asaccharovorans TaxID=28210 RepID=UPI00224C70FD|nr:N-acetylglucosamine-6-phosphate deacetylase [Chelatococcus asaccharovorans]CAH1655438.1 N-acetylgalactosamine-6-phosphate deacetylase [Chelatococcus asaccharovorans]CAH1685425.1 N-acetylgalactosamine-6-phosphate deacetylase [Chelatococcus asaccharovorans]